MLMAPGSGALLSMYYRSTGDTSLWNEQFLCFYLCCMPGTVRDSLDTLSSWVPQQSYEWRECISERWSNSPKLKRLTKGRISPKPYLCPRKPDTLQCVTKSQGSFVTRAISTTQPKGPSLCLLWLPCFLVLLWTTRRHTLHWLKEKNKQSNNYYFHFLLADKLSPRVL